MFFIRLILLVSRQDLPCDIPSSLLYHATPLFSPPSSFTCAPNSTCSPARLLSCRMRIPIVMPRDLHFSAYTGVLSLPKRFSHPGSRHCQRDIRREKTKSVSQLPTTKYLALQLDVVWCSAAPPVTFASGRSLYYPKRSE